MKEEPKINSKLHRNVNSILFHAHKFPLKLFQNPRGQILCLKTLLPVSGKINKSNHQIMNGNCTYRLANQGRVFSSWPTQNKKIKFLLVYTTTWFLALLSLFDVRKLAHFEVIVFGVKGHDFENLIVSKSKLGQT